VKAGALRHVVEVDEPITSRASTGEELVSFERAFRARADIEPLTGREVLLLGGIEETFNTRIVLRYSPTTARIKAKWRLRHRGTTYNIGSIVNTAMRDRELELLCSSGLNDG
jgi:SPP1 family predicted phage head-tail adaptor